MLFLSLVNCAVVIWFAYLSLSCPLACSRNAYKMEAALLTTLPAAARETPARILQVTMHSEACYSVQHSRTRQVQENQVSKRCPSYQWSRVRRMEGRAASDSCSVPSARTGATRRGCAARSVVGATYRREMIEQTRWPSSTRWHSSARWHSSTRWHASTR